ncbi:MAG: hypothetical protein JWQ02_3512 [Capsulimonas sp.]|nr:hypothetical protein [Capsulimonas sp.]
MFSLCRCTSYIGSQKVELLKKISEKLIVITRIEDTYLCKHCWICTFKIGITNKSIMLIYRIEMIVNFHYTCTY